MMNPTSSQNNSAVRSNFDFRRVFAEMKYSERAAMLAARHAELKHQGRRTELFVKRFLDSNEVE